jgi:diaminopimelate decarboxylase
MYGAYHPIVNASRVEGPSHSYVVAGNLCESGDVFCEDRELTELSVGDVVAILNAGAYGFSMASNYNLRPRPAEVIVRGGEVRLVGERETYAQLLRGRPAPEARAREAETAGQ